nr:GNAT family N-acetyltransferase [Flexivirga meconopsidis]
MADWLLDRGVEQWHPDDVPLKDIRAQVAAGEWFVLTGADDTIVATVRYLHRDDDVWPGDETPAAYLHGLMVDRSHAGTDVGGELLRWAERRAADEGRDHLRLDCVEANHALRNYYASQGFREVGRRAFEDPKWRPVALFEKPLPQPRT